MPCVPLSACAEGRGWRSCSQPAPPGDDVARFDESDVLAVLVGHGLAPQSHELVDVELVVGEQHEVLEPLRRGAGVVAQPVQRIVDPGRGEQRRAAAASPGCSDEGAVGDAVVHGAQVGQIEHVAHQRAPLHTHRAFDVVVLGEREMDRDRLRAGPDFDLDLVVFQQQPELLAVVTMEQIGPSERRLVAARPGHETVAQPRVRGRRETRHRMRVNPHERIARTHPPRQAVARHEPQHRLPQMLQPPVVDRPNLFQRRRSIGKPRRRNKSGHIRHRQIVPPQICPPSHCQKHHGTGFAGPSVLPPVRGLAKRHEVRAAWGRANCPAWLPAW